MSAELNKTIEELRRLTVPTKIAFADGLWAEPQGRLTQAEIDARPERKAGKLQRKLYGRFLSKARLYVQ